MNSQAETEQAEGLTRAPPEDVDRDSTMALGDCPTHGENSIATVRVKNAVYIAACGKTDCDQEVRAPVVMEDGKPVVKFNLDPEEVPLR